MLIQLALQLQQALFFYKGSFQNDNRTNISFLSTLYTLFSPTIAFEDETIYSNQIYYCTEYFHRARHGGETNKQNKRPHVIQERFYGGAGIQVVSECTLFEGLCVWSKTQKCRFNEC